MRHDIMAGLALGAFLLGRVGDELEPGGLGLHLIKKVFDEIVFCPGKELGNCVTMRLRRVKDEE